MSTFYLKSQSQVVSYDASLDWFYGFLKDHSLYAKEVSWAIQKKDELFFITYSPDSDKKPTLILKSPSTPMDLLKLLIEKNNLQECSHLVQALFMALCVDYLESRKKVELVLASFEGFREPDTIRRCVFIRKLPKALLSFCISKELSFKQVSMLMRYDIKLLGFVSNILSSVSFTASTLLKIVDMLHDCTRRYDLSADALFDRWGLSAILIESLSPKQKGQRLASAISEIHQPTLSSARKRIDAELSEINSPKGVTIQWDRTLENPGVTILMDIKKGDDLNNCMTWLKQEGQHVSRIVKGML